MRRIHFDETTVSAIRSFIEEGHTCEETCNRFTIKYDTLKRVMFENNILPYRMDKSNTRKEVTPEIENQVCNLFSTTKMKMADIVKETKLEYYVAQSIIDKHFDQEYQNNRRSKIYSASKLGDKNPMKAMCGANHPNYKGLVDDGQGYHMIKKPNWYTGRKGSSHVFYHSVVMCEALGITEIPKGFVVHHIDFNKHNNDISNLCLMTSSAHSKLHQMYNSLCKVQRLSEQE